VRNSGSPRTGKIDRAVHRDDFDHRKHEGFWRRPFERLLRVRGACGTPCGETTDQACRQRDATHGHRLAARIRSPDHAGRKCTGCAKRRSLTWPRPPECRSRSAPLARLRRGSVDVSRLRHGRRSGTDIRRSTTWPCEPSSGSIDVDDVELPGIVVAGAHVGDGSAIRGPGGKMETQA
jgi:hypothetical protein